MRVKVGIVVLLLAWSMNAQFVNPLALAQPSQVTPEQVPPYEVAALKALDSLKSKDFFAHVKDADEYARKLGFASAAEIADAVLGTHPLEVKRVGLTQLSKFAPGGNIEDLWDDVHTYIFPIYVKEEKEGAVRSSLTVAEIKKTWQWTRRGSPNLIRQLEKARAQIKQSSQSSDSLLVMIPGLNLIFLGEGTGSQLTLVPLSNAEIGNVMLKAGQPMPASLVFEKLAPEAVRILAAETRQEGGNRLLR